MPEKTNREMPQPQDKPPDGAQPRGRRPHSQPRDLVESLVFAIPFLAVTTINLRNTVALCAAFLVILVPVSVLRFLLREQLGVPQWLSVPLCALVSLMLASLSYYVIRFVSVEITDALGTYLYLLAAYPVLAAASSEKDIRSMSVALIWALRYFARFAALGLAMALIRELLAYGQLWGFSLGYGFRLEGAKMTFFGLILMAVLLAAVNQLRSWVRALVGRSRTTALDKPR